MVDRSNLISERAIPVVVVPTDNRPLPSKFVDAESDSSITSWDCDGVGAILTVGSITTGQRRVGLDSHAGSACTLTCTLEPCWRIVWVTCWLNALPYGDDASSVASVMNGRGRPNSRPPSSSAG